MTLFTKKSNGEQDNSKGKEESRENITLGAKIAAARKQHGYTQEEFSQLLGVTSQAVSKWENDISCPDIMLLPKISQLLGISIDELLGNVAPTAQLDEKSEPTVDVSKLNLKINVTGEGRRPVNVSVPLSLVKKMTKLGTGISNIVNVGSTSLNNSQIEQIFALIDEGVIGKLLDVTDESGQHVVIEIDR